MKVVVVFIWKFQVCSFVFVLLEIVFSFLMDDKEEKRASVVFFQEFYPNWDAL